VRGLFSFLLLISFSGCLGFHNGPIPGEPADGKFLDVLDARVRYLDVGEGPPVVLIHGFASSLETWDQLVPVLSERHRVIALDLKGFGWTDRPEGDYSPRAQADLVFALLDRLEVDKTSVVAHSWGCSVALAMALARPERVERLGLFDAWVFDEQVPMFFRWSRLSGMGEFLFALYYNERPDERLALAFFDPMVVPEVLVEAVERALARPGTRAATLAAVRGLDLAEMEKNYAGIGHPTLLLWGREDAVAPLIFGERLVRELPRARLITYPRCGHFPMLEAFAESSRDLAAFLAGGTP
jgi:pimeloyl-ACP methyl ester carboxylesterase